MKPLPFRIAAAFTLPLLSLALAGCSSLSTRTIQYVGVPRFSPADPARVEILHAEPARPHDRLGEVVVDASTDPAPAVERIEAALRRDAAKLGAEAVVLVYDRTQTVGAVVAGPWWDPWVSPIHGRVIIAVAIKYK